MLSFGQCEMKSSEAMPLKFPWVNFNAAHFVRIAIIFSTCFSICFKICSRMKILGKSFMTSLVAVEVATVLDSMFTAKINYSPGFKFQKLTIRSTSLLLLS